MNIISNLWQYLVKWMFRKDYIFDEYKKNILKTSIRVILASTKLTSNTKEDQIRTFKINFVNQYCFINIGQLLAKSMQIFEQYRINSGKATLGEGASRKHCISEL